MHFRILKMIATSGFLTAPECTKFVFGWDSAPDPAGGAYSAPLTPSWFKGGPTPKGKGRVRERRGKRKRGLKGTGEEGKGRVGPGYANSWIRPWK